MTEAELKALPQHSRIRYTGKDPLVLAQLKSRAPASYYTKGLVLVYVTDYSTNTWGNTERGIVLTTWSSGRFDKTVAADWEVVDSRRVDLTRKRERKAYQRADQQVKAELNSFIKAITDLQYAKIHIDGYLNNLPLPSKFKILASLDEEQKIWFELLSLDSATVISTIKQVVKGLTDETLCSTDTTK